MENENVITKSQKVPFRSKISYGLGEAGEAFSWTFSSMYLMYFWTDVFGLSIASSGLILFLTRVWDGISDLLIGNWIDKTNTKHGSYRPWILYSCVPMAIVNVLCFYAVPFASQGAKLVYALFTFMLLIFVYSCENVAQNAMTAAMTLDGQERASLSSYRTVFGYGGSILVSNLSLRCVSWFGRGDDAKGFLFTTIVYGVIMIALFIGCFKGTYEIVKNKPNVKISLASVFHAYKHNTPVIILSIAFAAMGLFTYGRSAVSVYYFRYLAGDRLFQTYWSTIQMIGSILGTICVPFLTRRFPNKSHVVILGWTLGGVLMVVLWFLNPAIKAQLILLYVLQMFIGIGLGIATTGIYSMVPDVTEFTQKLTGVKMTGTISAAISFFNKCGMAFGTAGAAWVLSMLGFIANQDQTVGVQNGIRALFTIVPGIIAIICVLIMFKYKLDKQTHVNIVNELYGDEAAAF